MSTLSLQKVMAITHNLPITSRLVTRQCNIEQDPIYTRICCTDYSNWYSLLCEAANSINVFGIINYLIT